LTSGDLICPTASDRAGVPVLRSFVQSLRPHERPSEVGERARRNEVHSWVYVPSGTSGSSRPTQVVPRLAREWPFLPGPAIPDSLSGRAAVRPTAAIPTDSCGPGRRSYIWCEASGRTAQRSEHLAAAQDAGVEDQRDEVLVARPEGASILGLVVAKRPANYCAWRASGFGHNTLSDPALDTRLTRKAAGQPMQRRVGNAP